MYMPRQIGIPAPIRDFVTYTEWPLPPSHKEIAFVTWQLKTRRPLAANCSYLVLPDVCTDYIFDLKASVQNDRAFIMASSGVAERVDLGTEFFYAGIRFFPGVLQTETANLPGSDAVWSKLVAAKDDGQLRTELELYINRSMQKEIAHKNWLMSHILTHADELHSAQDLERLSGYSGRQLRRLFQTQTSLSPSSFIKILKFQNSLLADPTLRYADQSHLIKEYKRITGLTPHAFKKTY